MLIRLQDRRWYLVRNLILALRNLGDPSVLPAIRNLRNHEHPRVREEVLKALLHFQDPDPDSHLIKDLVSFDPETHRNAIQLAEMSKDPLVVQGRLDLLQRSPSNGSGIEIKESIVRP
jgi:HEAT repeat protein